MAKSVTFNPTATSYTPTELDDLNQSLRSLVDANDIAVRSWAGDQFAVLQSSVDNLQSPSAPNAFYQYQYVRSDTLTATNNESYQRYLNLLGWQLTAGEYRIAWTYEYDKPSSKTTAQFKILANHAVIHRHSDDEIVSRGSTVTVCISGFDVLSLSGTVDFDLMWATTDKRYPTYLRKAVMEIWRIS